MSGDTIFAPATAAGPAGIAVIRISGPAAGAALSALTGRDVPQPRVATRVRLCDAAGTPLDTGLGLWFPRPASFTGEDVAELHVHGGRATMAALLAALGCISGLRLANPGEFTRRAFDNGKLDLAEVEGLADLIAAETEAQRRQALRQLEGALGRQVEAWRRALVALLATTEADIDFADQDLPAGATERVIPHILRLSLEITQHLEESRSGEIVRNGVQIAILGPPNAGKSSLLNALARREVAIVATEAGTTRDVIEVRLDLGGVPAVLADTAGLRAAEGVEAEGVRRARAWAEAADLRIVMFDAASPVDPDIAMLVRPGDLPLFNKIDLPGARPASSVNGVPAVAISVLTGRGMDEALAALSERVAALAGAGDALVTRARHRAALEECTAALHRAATADAPELAAEDLRLAARALGRITGRVGVEDVLDVLFREFCIGK